MIFVSTEIYEYFYYKQGLLAIGDCFLFTIILLS